MPQLPASASPDKPKPVAITVPAHTAVTQQRRAPTPPPAPPAAKPTAPVATNETKPEPAEPAPSASSGKNVGFLTMDTYPWAHVSTGGRVIGDTPLVHVPLSAGTHVLSLDNPAENLHETTVVTIKPGETVSRRLAF
jgi:serine/threonine-protein kinase